MIHNYINQHRLPANLRHEHPQMRAFTGSYFWSCKKNGGHSISSAVGERSYAASTLHCSVL